MQKNVKSKLIVSALLLIPIVGCVSRGSYQLKVQPYIITKHGQTAWTESWLERQTKFAQRVYQRADVTLEFLEPQRVERPAFYDFNETEHWDQMEEESKKYREQNHVIILWLTNTINRPNKSSPLGLSGVGSDGMVIAISKVEESKRNINDVAHEIGHQFGLKHSWEGTVPLCDENDCSTDKCNYNVMSYCNPAEHSLRTFKYTLSSVDRFKIRTACIFRNTHLPLRIIGE